MIFKNNRNKSICLQGNRAIAKNLEQKVATLTEVCQLCRLGWGTKPNSKAFLLGNARALPNLHECYVQSWPAPNADSLPTYLLDNKKLVNWLIKS